MQDFFCPECGAQSTFDPNVESAQCPKCGYSPPPIGGEGWREAFQPSAPEEEKPTSPLASIFQFEKSLEDKFLAFIRFDEDLYTFGEDANEIADALGLPLIEDHSFEGLPNPAAKLPFDKRKAYFTLLRDAGFKLSIARHSIISCSKCGNWNISDNLFIPHLPCNKCGTDPMKSDLAQQEVLQRGVEAAEAGETPEAQALLNYLLHFQPSASICSIAHFWLGEISKNLEGKAHHYEKASLYDPDNEVAGYKLDRVRSLLGKAERRFQGRTVPSQSPSPPPDQARSVCYECARCGGTIYFSPFEQSLSCRYCGHHQLIPVHKYEHKPGSDPSFYEAMARLEAYAKAVKTKATTCSGCGANFMLAPEILTFDCPYCSSESVLENQESIELILPTDVIPFSINEAQAKRFAREWLKEQGQTEAILVSQFSGVYVPIWLLHIEGFVNWEEKDKSSLSLMGSGLPHVRSGMIDVFEPQSVIPGIRKFSTLLLEETEHFDWDKAYDFDPRFLIDWGAEIYEVSLTEAGHQARSNVMDKTRESLKRHSGVDENIILDSRGVGILSYRLVLVPVWFTHFEHEGKTFPMLINGQRGTVKAEKQETRLRGFLSGLLD